MWLSGSALTLSRGLESAGDLPARLPRMGHTGLQEVENLPKGVGVAAYSAV